MARGYRMTPKRRAALKRAQAISARKRRGKGRGKLASANRRITRQKRVAVAIGALAGIGAAAYLGNKHRGRLTKGSGPSASKALAQSGNLKTVKRYKSPHVNHRAITKAVHGAMLERGITPRGGFKRNYQVDRDSIPLYNSRANKNWPHVGADVARKKNKKLRKRGLIE